MRNAIPALLQKCWYLCDAIFEGDEWSKVLSPNGDFVLGREADNNWFHHGNVTFQPHDNSAAVLLSELVLDNAISSKNNSYVQEFDAILNLLFHSFGGGSERDTTIRNMWSKQVLARGSKINYTLVHEKEYGYQTHT